MLLLDSVENIKKLLICGLAKNTGKTVALNSLLEESRRRSEVVGVTSIGRDGERFDVINSDIEKPCIYLCAGTLVATTLGLLKESGISHQLLKRTAYRTPMGVVVVARLLADGEVEVAGPNSAKEICKVGDDMLDMGVDRVLIDGAINRKAAASPMIADGIVLSTGAVLDTDLHEVVKETKNSVDKILVTEIADMRIKKIMEETPVNVAVKKNYDVIALNYLDSLMGEKSSITELVKKNSNIDYLLFKGALCEDLAKELLKVLRNRKLICVVRDSSKLFLGNQSLEWYAQQGLIIRVVYPTRLKAITVNPVAPGSHIFNSDKLLRMVREVISDVCVINVCDENYTSQISVL